MGYPDILHAKHFQLHIICINAESSGTTDLRGIWGQVGDPRQFMCNQLLLMLGPLHCGFYLGLSKVWVCHHFEDSISFLNNWHACPWHNNIQRLFLPHANRNIHTANGRSLFPQYSSSDRKSLVPRPLACIGYRSNIWSNGPWKCNFLRTNRWLFRRCRHSKRDKGQYAWHTYNLNMHHLRLLHLLPAHFPQQTWASTISSSTGPKRWLNSLWCHERGMEKPKLAPSYNWLLDFYRPLLLSWKCYERYVQSFRHFAFWSRCDWSDDAWQWSPWCRIYRYGPWQDSCLQNTPDHLQRDRYNLYE